MGLVRIVDVDVVVVDCDDVVDAVGCWKQAAGSAVKVAATAARRGAVAAAGKEKPGVLDLETHAPLTQPHALAKPAPTKATTVVAADSASLPGPTCHLALFPYHTPAPGSGPHRWISPAQRVRSRDTPAPARLRAAGGAGFPGSGGRVCRLIYLCGSAKRGIGGRGRGRWGSGR